METSNESNERPSKRWDIRDIVRPKEGVYNRPPADLALAVPFPFVMAPNLASAPTLTQDQHLSQPSVQCHAEDDWRRGTYASLENLKPRNENQRRSVTTQALRTTLNNTDM